VQSHRFLALLPAGLTGHVLRLSDPEFPARLDALLRDGIPVLRSGAEKRR